MKYLGFLLIPAITFMLGLNVGLSNQTVNKDNLSVITENNNQDENIQETTHGLKLSLFWETMDLLKARYVKQDAFDSDKLLYGAIKGMVASVGDPYTLFMTPKENKDFQESLHGELQGIGAQLALKDGLIVVVSPLKDSPAAKAGIHPEDIILKVDGEDATNMTLEQAVMHIRGPKNTEVVLNVFHKGAVSPVDISIIRGLITLESVSMEMKEEDQIAYISINQFGDNTIEEFDKALDDVLLKNPRGIILDLRFNGGGYLDGAIELVSRFLKNKVAVIIKKRDKSKNEIHYTSGPVRVPDLPVVVLINKGSASASEIFAGALQDHKRSYTIGESSFGKGTVQEVNPLSDGSSLRVTIAEWYTPNDKSITDLGITPDLVVERTLEDFKNEVDPQMDAAIEYLNNL